MSYMVNPSAFSAVFTLPCEVADKYLKLATHNQLKVLLHIMRNLSSGIDANMCADALSLPLSEVEDALIFWTQNGILKDDTASAPEKVATPTVITTQMPSRSDIIRRGMEDSRLAFLLREAQLKFGRNLKQNESALLLSLYDDHGMDVSVILVLLQYAVSEGKCNISFIKSTASRWISDGVETVVQAEEKISNAASQKLCWRIVERVFGIEKRNPSERELELCELWINKWNMNEEMLKLAYDACVNAKTKLSIPYIAKILESWQKMGCKTPKDVQALNTAKQTENKAKKVKNSYAGYDLDLFEKMLNNDD